MELDDAETPEVPVNAVNPSEQTSTPMSRRTFGISVLAAAVAGLAACSDSSGSTATTAASATGSSGGEQPGQTGVPATTSAGDDSEFYDASVLHGIRLEFDTGEYDAMIAAFVETGDKGWLETSATIDGTSYRQVGIRLKGNSSLAGLGGGQFPGAGRPDASAPTGDTEGSVPVAPPGGIAGVGSASADEPEGLPWLIRLDKFIEDQHHQGLTEFVVRSNSSATSMNEAVSVGLLDAAGLATQRACAAEFTVNDRPARLRLVVENPNEEWTADRLGGGNLYKADASGDYSYRGEDAADYAEAWEQEVGEDDLTPLIEFLDFVNNADDATFAAELDDHLDVEAFATYMAIEDLLENFDDISGPGNNSYLYLDESSGRFTVVAWDHNLALSSQGAFGGGGGGFDPPQMPGGTLPDGFDPSQPPGGTLPDGFDPSQFPGGGGPFGKSNALADRFMATPAFTDLYDRELARLRSELFESGLAQEILDEWSGTLLATATHLVDASVIKSETEAIAGFFVEE